MNNLYKILIALILLICLLPPSSAQFSDDRIRAALEGIGTRINDFVLLLFCLIWYLAAALAALIIVWSGIKYLSSETFEGRNKAKRRAIHALVGLIIVLIACPLINYLIGGMPVREFSCVCVP